MQIRYPKARLSPSKRTVLTYSFHRDSIEAGEIDTALLFLQLLIEDAEAATYAEGTVKLRFPGWEDKLCPIAEILTIRQWFATLTNAFPYWLHFCEKEGDTLSIVFTLLSPGHYVKIHDQVAWHYDDLPQCKRVLDQLVAHFNELYARLGLSKDMQERVTQEVSQYLEGQGGVG
jgi:hypothetical protein